MQYAVVGTNMQTWFREVNVIEQFSTESRKVFGFESPTHHDWLKKLFHPIRSKTITIRDSLARVFPRFASATCNYFKS